MKKDVLIVGAGVVGLSVAKAFAEQGIATVVIEKNSSAGMEISSRNSGVIHAGLYYEKNSLKASLCLRGKHLLYEYLQKKNLPYKKIGKLIVASGAQVVKLDKLLTRAIENEVDEISMVSASKISEWEPNVIADQALLSGSTGILSQYHYLRSLENDVTSAGGVIEYRTKVEQIIKTADGYSIEAACSDGSKRKINAPVVVNAAGLYADEIAALCGINAAESGYSIYPCKGEYFSLAAKFDKAFNHLIYPIPENEGLGIHTVVSLAGKVRLGPNVVYQDSKFDYSVNANHRENFFAAAKGYIRSISIEDLSPSMSGIRPKLQRKNEGAKDFVIREETDRGLHGFVNLIGIESPGLTSSLAIAELVRGLV